MPKGSGLFTVCVLTHGEYEPTFRRCIDSIVGTYDFGSWVHEIRVGLNAPSSYTIGYVRSLKHAGILKTQSIFMEEENIYKYPLMRKMFYSQSNPITTPYVMWFDDDSFIKPDTQSFFARAASEIKNADFLGHSKWVCRLSGNQHLWIRKQPWYKGKTVSRGMPVTFFLGAWWVGRVSSLMKLDYPWPELQHRGGDVMLGEAIRQNDLETVFSPLPVLIGANWDGDDKNKMPRRTFDSQPIGHDYEEESSARPKN